VQTTHPFSPSLTPPLLSPSPTHIPLVLRVVCLLPFLAVTALAQEVGTCPPPGYDAVKDFDLQRYISAPWYVQLQQPVSYQPPNQLYCVRAKYTLQPDGTSLQVLNTANEGSVTGPPVGGNPAVGALTATIPDPSRPSKLAVGFSLFGRQLGSGPYWVVALDPDYQWAIITGGPPTQVGLDGTCRTGTGQNDSGFWLFSRKPVDPENTEIMLEVAREELGLDLSVLLPVQQEGCTYP